MDGKIRAATALNRLCFDGAHAPTWLSTNGLAGKAIPGLFLAKS